MAVHTTKSGEGDCSIPTGVETLSRYVSGASDMAPNSIFQSSGELTKARAAGSNGIWGPADGLPDMYIENGQTAENVSEPEAETRREIDEFDARSQQRAVANQENGFSEREITPLIVPNGTVVAKDDGPRAGTTVEALADPKPVFRPAGEITAGNACPINNGAAAVIVMTALKQGHSVESRWQKLFHWVCRD